MRPCLPALAALAAIAAWPAHAQPAQTACMAKATTTIEMGDCHRAALDSADKALNEAYRKTLAVLPPDRQATLRTEQRAWIVTRDRTCKVPPDSGTAGPLQAAQCMQDQTEARTRVLEAMSANKP